MNDVLAVLEGDPETDPRTAQVAAALGDLLHDRVRDLDVPTTSREGFAHEVVAALSDTAVWTAVLAARDDPEAACWALAERAPKPVVMVPGAAVDPAGQISRVLLPLDGDPHTADAVAGVVARLSGRGARILPLHVFEPQTVPAFWDQPAHTGASWSSEFVLRNLPHDGDLYLRRGVPAEELLDVVRSSGAHLVVLGWAQHLAEGRAETVRRVVHAGTVPVLLVPVLG